MQPLPPIDRQSALFLDFDGTLVDFAATPDAVRVDAALIELLGHLAKWLDGALALISGRPIAHLDALLAPLELPTAGVHGAERRRADRRIERLRTPALDAVAAAALDLAARHAGLLVECKTASVALHYRGAPALEARCLEVMTRAAQPIDGVHVLHGKMLVEVVAAGVSKGRAIEAFLGERPFAGRAPVFVGDDVTDETGFEVVRVMGGRNVKVGDGQTVAGERIDSTAAVRRWLLASSDNLRG